MKHLLLGIGLSCSVMAYAQYPVVNINDLQFVLQSALGNCDDQTVYLGDTVTVRAKVVMDGYLAVPSGFGATNGHKNVWLQQGNGGEWSGIDVFSLGGTNVSEDIHNLLAGDSVEIVGVIEDFNGETELMPLEGNSISILGQGATLVPTVVTIADLNDENRLNQIQTGERWEGVYAEFHNVSVATVDPFSGGTRVSFNVQDQNGNLMNVSDRFLVQKLPGQGGNFVAPNVGDQLDTLRGIIAHSKNLCPGSGSTNRGYELYPFQESDYVYGASAPRISIISRTPLVPSATESVDIEAEITDSDGQVVSATLRYGTGTSGSLTSVGMTFNSTTGYYEATIPAQANNTLVRWNISATDDSASTTTVPNSDPSIATYIYWVRSGGLTIPDVQYTPFANGNSPYLGQEVTVSGVVTAAINTSDTGDLGYVFIQQPGDVSYAGIWLQQGTDLTTLSRGDAVTVTGTVAEVSGMTALNNVHDVTVTGSGSVEMLILNPDSLTNYSFDGNEPYEGMLVRLENPTVGNKLFVVEQNADEATGNNYAEYRIGTDPFTLSGARVLAGRQTNSAYSSLFFSYVNDSLWQNVSGVMAVNPYVVHYPDSLTSLTGILFYSFGAMKLLPRNNHDMVGYAGNVYASFEAAADSVCVNAPITFINQSSVMADQFAWDFGDGNTANTENPEHTYTSGGWMTVSLTATNSINSASGSASLTNVVYVDTLGDCATGTEEVRLAPPVLSVFPNPANGERVSIQLSGATTFSATVFDALGNEVKSLKASNGAASLQISDLAAGTYVVKATANGASHTGRLIVTRR